jgi:hypothetical protein
VPADIFSILVYFLTDIQFNLEPNAPTESTMLVGYIASEGSQSASLVPVLWIDILYLNISICGLTAML